MRVLAGAFVLATLMDLVTFLRMVDVAGLEAEQNALVVHLAEQGIAFAIAAKLLVLVAGLSVAAAIHRIGKYRAVGELVLVVGILVGAFGAGANVTVAATPRSAMQPAPSLGIDGYEKDGPLPSAAAWRTGAPLPTDVPGPLVRTPEPTGTGAAAHGVTPDPDPSGVVSSRNGVASWYAARGLIAAAGPELRAMLGPAWRGQVVEVAAGDRRVRVRLTDWCQCYRGTATERLIDLSDDAFRELAPLSRGLVRVEVRADG